MVEFDFARCFFRTGKHTAKHDAVCACCQSFGDVAREADAAVGNQRNAGTFEGFGNIVNGGQLRYAYARNNTGGTNRTRSDTDFDGVCSCCDQIQSGFGGCDIAADDLYVRIGFFHPFHALDNTLAMAVCSIDDDDVDSCSDQGFYALFGVAAGADSRTYTQTAFGVFVGIRKLGGFQNIFYGNQAFKLVFFVQDQNALDFMFVHQFACLVDACAFGDGNQAFARGHDGGNGQVETVFKTQVAVGNDTDHFAVFYDGQTGHFAFALRAHFQYFANKRRRRNRNRVFHYAALMAFYFRNGTRLHFGRHVFMDNADTAFLRHGNGEACFGNGVHCGGK